MVTETDIQQQINTSDEPFVTASEVADSMGVARQTAYKHLQRMHESGELRKRKIGSSAVIWWREAEG